MLRTLLAVVALLVIVSPAAGDTDGAGTQIGAPVPSTLSLDLAQTGSTVRATVTTTEPGALLSATPVDGRSGLSATVSGPYAPLDPAFGLPLAAWDDVFAGLATTLHLKSASPATSTVFITL